MTSPKLHLTRARLRARRGEALASIAPLLLPQDPAKSVAAAHRIVWMLFHEAPPDTSAAASASWRDAAGGSGFLWREEGEGNFMILSRRPPADPHGLFEIRHKPFEPELSSGMRLRFSLRANPTTSKPAERGEDGKCKQRGQRVDVVMHALHSVPRTDWKLREGRAFERDRLVQETVTAWLARQGEKAGFAVPQGQVADPWLDEDDGICAAKPLVRATNYTQLQVERRGGKGRRPAGISIVDVTGEIIITDPAAFLARLARGFGSAKAFGNGLMLIRRA